MQKFRQSRNTCVSWSFVSSFIYHSIKYSQTLKRMLACNIIMTSKHSSSLQKRPLSKNRETLILNLSYHMTLFFALTFFSTLKVLNNWIVAYSVIFLIHLNPTVKSYCSIYQSLSACLLFSDARSFMYLMFHPSHWAVLPFPFQAIQTCLYVLILPTLSWNIPVLFSVVNWSYLGCL